ncbi:MAG: ferritin-like domain-containing protein, partial [Gemmatimonadota bacterium]
MLSKKIQAALDDQINNEFYAAYLYLSMSGYFQGRNLT